MGSAHPTTIAIGKIENEIEERLRRLEIKLQIEDPH
jgi:hypothetical protein